MGQDVSPFKDGVVQVDENGGEKEVIESEKEENEEENEEKLI
jgi:hypothetical protein